MNKSEQINELAKALTVCQGQLKPAEKNVANSFFKSKYAALPDVMEACRQPMSKNGLAIIQTTDTSENGMVLETILVHTSGQWVSSLWPINPVKSDPQGLMSAVTYARRGSLMAILGIVADDASDDDGNAASGNREGMISEAMGALSSTEANLTRLGHFKAEGREAAEGGSFVLATWWKKLLPSDQKNLATFKDTILKPMAEAADKEAAE